MGKEQRTIVLYGNSLVIAGLAASLECQSHLILHQVIGRGVVLAQQLAALQPDVLIFDLAAGPPDNAFLLLQEHPHLLLIGVDLNRHEMRQWAGQHIRAQTVQDMVQTIQQWTEKANN